MIHNHFTLWGFILGVIVVCFLFVIGMGKYRVKTQLEQMDSDLYSLAQRAQRFYHRPAFVGGGGSFVDLTADEMGMSWLKPEEDILCQSCKYEIIVAGNTDSIVLGGKGEMFLDGSFLTRTVTVFPDSLYLREFN